MNTVSLSKVLRGLRVGLGLSLSQLAARVNTSVPTLSRYESGWERFEIYTLGKIAMALGYRLNIEFVPLRQMRAPRTVQGVIRKIGRLFWDHKLKKSDFSRYPVWITERVIEFGTLEDVKALVNIMGRRVFLKNVSNSRFQSSKTERFWRTILEKEGVACTKRSFPREVKSC